MFEADRNVGASRWLVLRLARGSTTEVVLLSRKFFALTTHWVGHTVVCPTDNCVLCETLATRGLFYLAVHCCGHCRILELGAQSASLFEQHAKLLHGGMVPGLVFELSRRTAKSPVHSEVHSHRPGTSEVSMLDLARRVMAVYKFPPPQPDEDIDSYGRRCQLIARRRAEQIQLRLASSPNGRVGGR